MGTSTNSLKVVLISYHNINNPNFRSSALWSVIKEKHQDAIFYYANWDHLNKKQLPPPSDKREKALSVPGYSKNLSIARMFSHLVFSFKVLFKKEIINSNIIVCSAPPNLVLLPLILIRIFKPQIKIVCDVVDLWPEAIPLSAKQKKLFNIFASVFWTLPRNLAYKTCDALISHCEYFLNEIGPAFLPQDTKHIPLCLMDYEDKEPAALGIEKEIRFLLLGSINNIFDEENCITFFKELCRNDEKGIYLEIIGLGEGLERLLLRLRSEVPKLNVKGHGAIFDRKQKDEIMSHIHFGLNLYKNTTAIGVSYKSIEYLAHGIPIINSAQGDLYELTSKRSVGLNLGNDYKSTIDTLLSFGDSSYRKMQINSFSTYQEMFSKRKFQQSIISTLEDN